MRFIFVIPFAAAVLLDSESAIDSVYCCSCDEICGFCPDLDCEKSGIAFGLCYDGELEGKLTVT